MSIGLLSVQIAEYSINHSSNLSSSSRRLPLSRALFEFWTILRQRFDDTLSFKRDWMDFKNGFSDEREPNGNFWIGLEKMHQLTTNERYRLRFLNFAIDGQWRQADYDNITIDSEKNRYQWHFGEYSGDAGDALRYNDDKWNLPDMPLSTCDHTATSFCTGKYKCGWWFNNCMQASLTCGYNRSKSYQWLAPWLPPESEDGHLKASIMMIQKD